MSDSPGAALAAAAGRIAALQQGLDEANAKAAKAEAAQATIAAEVGQLRRDLAAANDARDAALADNNAAALVAATAATDAAKKERVAIAARDAANAKLTTALDDLAQTKAALAEAGKPLPPPGPGSAVVTVTYSDGRVKYAAPDGTKFVIAADAERHIKILRLVDKGGILEREAARLVDAGILALDPKS